MMAIHDCGGTILVGGVGGERHTYCARCGAYRYGEDVEALPTGTDKAANYAAWDAGEDASPEATSTVPCHCGSREAYWHGPEDGSRVYCCDPCWKALKG